MACPKLLSFAELVQGRDSSVRITDDRLLYAVDLTMVVHGSDRNVASKVSPPLEILINHLGLPR